MVPKGGIAGGSDGWWPVVVELGLGLGFGGCR